MNAFDSGDDGEDNEDENDKDSENEENVFKRFVGKLTQTKTTSVFPVQECPVADGSCNSSQEIQTTARRQNMGKEYSTVGKCVCYGTNSFHCGIRSSITVRRYRC